MILIFSFCAPCLYDTTGPMAAAALAAGLTSRALTAAAFPQFSLQIYQRLSVQGAVSLFVRSCCLLLFPPFVFGRYGFMLRAIDW
jgi:DHA1 family multidrug resistance protein-like MFS transporter